MHAKSIYGLKKPIHIRNELENRFQGRHFASQIASETLWGFLGAPERTSECARDVPGTLLGRSGHAPERYRDVLGTLLAPLRASLSHHGNTFWQNSHAIPRQRGFGSDFGGSKHEK